jgi:hypothetical protein
MLTSSVFVCLYCKKTKDIHEEKNIYFEGTKKHASSNMICAECYPAIVEEIALETKDINYIGATVKGILATFVVTALFYPIFSMILTSDSVLNLVFGVALLPGAVIAAFVYFGSGKKRNYLLMFLSFILISLSFLMLHFVFLLNLASVEVHKVNPSVSILKILTSVFFAPTLEFTKYFWQQYKMNLSSEFSLLILFMMIVSLLFFGKRTLRLFK